MGMLGSKSVDHFMMWGKGGRAKGIDLMVTATPLIAGAIADAINYPGLGSLSKLLRVVAIGEVA